MSVPRPDSAVTSGLPVLDGYVLDRQLGEGGMGVVYGARELATNRAVALKMLRRVDPQGIYRLKREFRTLAEIAHPNLVKLYELHCVDEQWFFTMELISGASFLQFVGVDHWWTPEPCPELPDTVDLHHEQVASADSPGSHPDAALRVRRGFAQLVEGLSALHRADKIHCDIKPSNVMADENARVVVLDFGISHVIGRPDPHVTLERAIEGTPEYMAPEQILQQPLGPAADLYAVGTMLYEVLTGARPFAGGRSQLMVRKVGGPPVPPSAVRRAVPRDLEALCMDLLSVTPERRPTSEEVLALLRPEMERAGPSTARSAGSSSSRPGPASSPSSSIPTSPLIGRESELEWLRATARESAFQQPIVAVVTGESGIGKSALVDAFAHELTARPGDLVLRGRCYEFESVPYKAFDPLLDELTRLLCRLQDRQVAELLPRDIRALGRVFPVLNRVGAVASASGRGAEGDLVEVRHRASRALKELLARLADRWRLTLIIDDLQWGDVDSAGLLLDILEPPDPPPALVVLACRDTDPQRSPMLRVLLGAEASPIISPLIRQLRASALPPDDAAQLARRVLGDEATSEVLAAIARESSGNPFFVRELAESARLARSGVAPIDSDSVRFEPVLRARIESLRPELRDTLELVAVAGQPLAQGVVADLRSAAADAVAHCRDLRDAHLIRTLGPPGGLSVECFHDRTREAVIAAMSPQRVAECHRRLATTLERRGDADPEVLLEHYRRAGDQDSACRHVVASAEAARRALAFSRAARLYRLALDLVPRANWSRLELQSRLAEALALEGSLKFAGEAYARASEDATGADAFEFRRLAAQHLLTAGDLSRGLQALERLLSDVGIGYPATPRTALVRLLAARVKLRLGGMRFRERDTASVPPSELARVDACFSAAVGLAMSDLARAAAFSAEHLVLALRAGEPSRIARGFAFEMGLAPGAGEEGLRWATRALPVAERLTRSDDPYLRGLFYLSQGHVAYLSGHWRAAVDWVTRADTAFRDAHTTAPHWALQSANVIEAHAAAAAGDLLAVEARLPALLKEARRRGDLHSLSLFVYPGVLVHLLRDRVEAARALLRATARDSPGASFDLRDFTALHCALIVDRYEGQPHVAWTRLSEKWSAIQQSKILVVNIVRTTLLAERGTAAMSMLSSSDATGPYLRVARDCARRLSREGLKHARVLGRVLDARVSHVLGDTPRAVRELGEASLELETVGMSKHATCSRWVIGWLTGGPTAPLLLEMEATLRSQGVEHPTRFVELMIPGFGSAPGAVRASPANPSDPTQRDDTAAASP